MNSPRSSRLRPTVWLAGLLLGLSAVMGMAATVSLDSSPIQFFTNVATRLLQSEMNLDLGRIQIHPTNQYTPAVHRLLQLSANLYDATTNRSDTGYPWLPSVFRPRFTNDQGNVFITGYTEATDTNFLANPIRDLNSPADVAALSPDDSVYGVPVIIGAKKGFPNFNEFTMQTAAQVQRRLSFDFTDPANRKTNQMYVLGITNVFGVEAWNSYSNAYPRTLALLVTNEVITTIVTSNGNNEVVLYATTNLVSGTNDSTYTNWLGIKLIQQSQWVNSFKLPLHTNLVLLPRSAFIGNATNGFTQDTSSNSPGWSGNSFPVPQWWLRITNRLRYILVDTGVTPNRVVDYVSFNDLGQSENLSEALMYTNAAGNESAVLGNVWRTDRVGGVTNNDAIPTMGIINQMRVCTWQPGYQVSDADWAAYGGVPGGALARQHAIDQFCVNLGLYPLFYPINQYSNYVMFDAPFQPLRTIYAKTSWQVNDPLVHYTAADLTDLSPGSGNKVIIPLTPPNATPPSLVATLKVINSKRYEPWPSPNYSGAGGNSSSTTLTDLKLKDPLVTCSDDWQFPTNASPYIGWIGRVHRGTPWQTVYLKSESFSNITAWARWTGNSIDPLTTQPTNDWRIASLLAAMFTTNNPHQLLSPNNRNMNTWLNALNGLAVLTNTISDGAWMDDPFQTPQFTNLVIDSSSPQATTVAQAISAARQNEPGGYFNAGRIFTTPELGVASPWLNKSSIQQELGISEDAYEMLPRQLLALLQLDSIGAINFTGNQWRISFSGYDGFPYAVQTSSNLVDWTSLSTNLPQNGTFIYSETPAADSAPRYYRSVLLP